MGQREEWEVTEGQKRHMRGVREQGEKQKRAKELGGSEGGGVKGITGHMA